MATNKRPTKTKKSAKRSTAIITSSIRNKPRFRALYLVLFLLVFGFVGYRVFFAHAASPYPTDADQIVAELQTQAGSHVYKDPATGTEYNLLSPGDVIVAGDGTLYCDNTADGTTTTGKLGPGELKQLFDNVNGSDVRGQANSQKVQVSDTTDYDTVSTLVVNATDQAQVLYSSNDTTGVFAKTAAKLQQKCKDKNPQVKVNKLPDFKDVNTPSTDEQSRIGFLSRVFFASVSADTYLSGDGMFNDINGHRNSTADSAASRLPVSYETAHPPISLTRKTCLNTIARNYAYKLAHGAPWRHNPYLESQINNGCSSNWTTYGEDIGAGPSLGTVFSALLNSPCHHENIDSRNISGDTTAGCHWEWTYYYERYNYVGVGAYQQTSGTVWYVIDFARW